MLGSSHILLLSPIKYNPEQREICLYKLMVGLLEFLLLLLLVLIVLVLVQELVQPTQRSTLQSSRVICKNLYTCRTFCFKG